MDVFKFIDDSVRGAIRFVADFLRTTATLVLHPVRGPYRLMARYRREAVPQISPITYLALAFIVASLAPVLATEGERGSELSKGLARLFATGSLSSDIVPFLIGVIMGTVTIDVLLQTLSRRLSGTRRERFVGIMEYYLGAFLLVLFPLVNAVNSLLGEETAIRLFAIPFGWIAFFITIHFYSLLFRRRKYHAWMRRVRRVPRGLRRDGFMPSLGKAAKEARSLGILWFVWTYLMLTVWILAWLVPFLILGLGMAANVETARWLSERPDGTAVLTVAGLQCGLDGDLAMARATFWNGSEWPALNWSTRISVRPVARDGSRGPALRWDRRLPDNRRDDLVLPGGSLELTGRVSGLERQSLPADAARDWPCVLESGDGSVGLRGI